jgi:N6-adenosine-specific RNA methylase IME4/ParB-like chromosome segregation protein Spo0J
MEMLISEIIIGKRHRRDMGDIAALAQSIATIGLLHPAVVTKTGELVAGARRIEAHLSLGRKTIPYRVIDMEAIILGELAENDLRKDFTVSERTAIGREIEVYVGERRGRDNPQNLAELKGKETRTIAAEKAGFGNAETYRQAKAIVENGAPELIAAVDANDISVSAGAAIALLPRNEQAAIVEAGPANVVEAAKKIRTDRADQKRQDNAALKATAIIVPEGKFSTIVIDPPWEMEKIERDVRPNQVAFDYPTMDETELLAFKGVLDPMVADDCHLLMWTTQKHLQMALRLVDAYGFRHVLTMVWTKPGGFQPIGLPQYNVEFIVYARRGTPKFIDTKAFNCGNSWPRREHSRKPNEFYELIARVTDGPRVDVFSRELRAGFEQFGNEIGKFPEVAA